MARNSSPLITVDNVSKTYGTHPEDYNQLVLINVKVAVEEGEFVIIFGPSGSGKSTLLNVMAGLEFPTGGRVFIHGKNLAKMTKDQIAKYHRERMGMVFQSFNLIRSLTVWENVALPQVASGVRYGLRRHRAIRLLKLLQVDKYADRKPMELSGGQQQRVAIARALINNPSILLVDEPTGNLDTKMADEVMSLIHDLHYRANHTVVLVTHNPDYLRFASRVIYIKDGQIEREVVQEHDVATVQPVLPEEYYSQLVKLKGK